MKNKREPLKGDWIHLVRRDLEALEIKDDENFRSKKKQTLKNIFFLR